MMREEIKAQKTFWIASADMGYGHQRAVYPLRDIAEGGAIITVGSLQNNTDSEQKQWKRLLGIYELFSRAASIKFIGKFIFGLLDTMLAIPSYYPMRNLSSPTLQTRMLVSTIKKGLSAGFLEKISSKKLPIITSFFAPAIAADMHGHDEVFCIICDADLNRVWVSENPFESRITYFAPCAKAAQRLRLYGVPDSRIWVTGFPLPDELVGGTDMHILKKNLLRRLANLDPTGKFAARHGKSIEYFLGAVHTPDLATGYLTIAYAIGGAGAQAEIGFEIASSLKELIKAGKVKLIILAGVKTEINQEYKLFKQKEFGDSEYFEIVHHPELYPYFDLFNRAIANVDVLWTKPSELSFYTALGIPIIMSPALGSQEQFNKYWLFEITSGIKQLSPQYASSWLMDYLAIGRLADAAWAGFLKARKLGQYKIREILEKGDTSDSDSPTER